jgi:3-dehydro-L-gulonate 2-dehydrogenase
MRVSFDQLKNELERVLLNLSFSKRKAELCATVFASNSRDGVYSHGLTRFPVFVDLIREGLINPKAEPECIEKFGMLERWTGNSGLGIYNATLCMERAINLAKENGMGCVAIQNTNHWLRGGTYGWQAADAGCISISFTNAIASMPPWGGQNPALGNNPVVIAVPRKEGHIVLDMAMSQFSYGKMQEYQLKNELLPFPGGYDLEGNLTNDPQAIIESKRALPIGFWKGSGLAFLIDILVTSLSGGRSTQKITNDKKEIGVSQVFICISPIDKHADLVDEIIEYTKAAGLAKPNDEITYPGENTLRKRKINEMEGIPVNQKIWESVLAM